jgi:hypothetical protein
MNNNNLTHIRVALGLVVGGLVTQVVAQLFYVFTNFAAIADFSKYGWGKVPMANLNTFIWLSTNLQWITICLTSYGVSLSFTFSTKPVRHLRIYK